MGMKGRWRYVVPNLLTSVSISLGLYAIGQSVAGKFDNAAWACLICVLLDKADGTAARLLKASSEFGAQMDSLSDLITFGVAPGTLVLAALVGHKPVMVIDAIPLFKPFVYVSAFLFVICSALRLAKFNIVKDAYGKDYFFGIPTTMCGAVVCAYYLTLRKYELPWQFYAALPAITFILALLLVSRVPLHKLGVRKSMAMNIFQFSNVAAAYVFGFMRIFPEYLLAIASSYMIGSVLYLLLKGVRAPQLRYNTASGVPERIEEGETDSGDAQSGDAESDDAAKPES
ncbi:MAG: phosphatidylcholine/phosphatidylserine synthase [Myxococcales bacterium]|nr:phosphatidylcholine/phosphatidylserine synthase [Myxococcales bacterium]